VQESRMGRETAYGRMGLFVDREGGVGAMVELLCESAPVAANDEFIALAADMAKQLATGPGAKTSDELLDQPAAGGGKSLRDRMLDVSNRIREVFKVGRIARIDGTSAGYAHHAGRTVGVLVEVEGGTPEAARDVCLHIASMAPQVLAKQDVPAAEVEKEREILSEAARKEGKPENIIAKMVEGRLRNFYAERALLEQPFVKDQSMTVGKFAAQHGMKIKRYIYWELGK